MKLPDTYVQVVEPAGSGGRIVVSVPHDGLLADDVAVAFHPRSGVRAPRDVGTWPLARDIGRKYPATLVRGLLPRIVCDYNREARHAFVDPVAKESWRAYHVKISRSIQASLRAGLTPMLLDLHGFGWRQDRVPEAYRDFDLILGTRYRTTVFSEIDYALGGFLRARGYRVFVPGLEPVCPGGDFMPGAFTIQRVSQQLGVDAIQLEVAKRFRTREGAAEGRQLAADVAAFCWLR